MRRAMIRSSRPLNPGHQRQHCATLLTQPQIVGNGSTGREAVLVGVDHGGLEWYEGGRAWRDGNQWQLELESDLPVRGAHDQTRRRDGALPGAAVTS